MYYITCYLVIIALELKYLLLTSFPYLPTKPKTNLLY